MNWGNCKHLSEKHETAKKKMIIACILLIKESF